MKAPCPFCNGQDFAARAREGHAPFVCPHCKAQARIAELEDHFKAYVELVANAEKERDSWSGAHSVAAFDRDQAKQALGSMTRMWENVKKERDEARNATTAITEYCRGLNAEVEREQRRSAGLVEDIERLRAKLAKAEQTIDELNEAAIDDLT